jgi:hypothetical protein
MPPHPGNHSTYDRKQNENETNLVEIHLDIGRPCLVLGQSGPVFELLLLLPQNQTERSSGKGSPRLFGDDLVVQVDSKGIFLLVGVGSAGCCREGKTLGLKVESQSALVNVR